MSASKFTEIMDPQFHCTSPNSDVRLEDILAATESHSRGRTPSETSSNASGESRQNSGERTENKTKQRLSRLLSIKK
ncbi:uncharacterized protein HMPREF1541_04993 [Cyphellophora europaea CBS 101466]|uniref:Uncharacterized protein n=1 Tax=Cyphellophora europaea (strain CBS 101466) TaxID=1220924 RepID=W2RY44_CYPE1|nr:uncharacterized protein HMPREF1541_04993 [Cyphellophora europaea CBS 101466]ETN40713.1 hypothetical protein HMPREF1541_04993 [Cyphellophora europaea CBS 101466]